MTPEQWAGILTAVAVVLGAIVTALKVVVSRRQAAAAARRAERTATSADWAAFAQQMQQALDDERQAHRDAIDRIDNLQRLLEAKTLLIRAQGDHIDLLEHHIWQRLPPPPPPRPAGL
jgi:uncharacterized membrane protein YccC